VIIARLILGLCGLGMFLIGFLTIVTPDINHIYVPFDVTSDPMAIFVRTYGGFFLAAGYLTYKVYLLVIKSSNWQYSYLYCRLYDGCKGF
jgi:hypothetical protein